MTPAAPTARPRPRGPARRGLALRRAARLRPTPYARARTLIAPTPASPSPSPAHRPALTPTPSANYTQRVLAGEFEPTALRARAIAAQRNQSLHALAAELGYADPPPRVRRSVALTTLTHAQLCEHTGYHKSEISRFFARRHPPTLSKLARIAAAYDAWMDDVLSAMGW